MKLSKYELRVRQLETEGMTRSDAQAVADAEEMRGNSATIGGITFQATRKQRPVPHWEICVAGTCQRLECYSKPKSLAHIWDYIGRDLTAVGPERFKQQFQS